MSNVIFTAISIIGLSIMMAWIVFNYIRNEQISRLHRREEDLESVARGLRTDIAAMRDQSRNPSEFIGAPREADLLGIESELRVTETELAQVRSQIHSR
jgi:hypothetical protein